MTRSGVVVLGSDHAGFRLKKFLKERLEAMGWTVEDVGTHTAESVDYPDYAEKVARGVLRGRTHRGVLICGTGIGASIAANKLPGIRAALVSSVKEARLSREHNDANLLVLGGWAFDSRNVSRILSVWLKTKALGGRHRRRVRKILRIEKKYARKR